MILKGLNGILESRKGTAFLLVLAISGTALLTTKLDGVSFAATIATIFAVFTATHAYQQGKNPS